MSGTALKKESEDMQLTGPYGVHPEKDKDDLRGIKVNTLSVPYQP